MPIRIAPGLSRLMCLGLAGVLGLFAAGPLWGQERELRGGHSGCPCDVCREGREQHKKKEQANRLERYRGGARVVTVGAVQREEARSLPAEMGFRPPSRNERDDRVDEPVETPQPSLIDQAAEQARLRREARGAKKSVTPPKVVADLRLGAAAFRRTDYEQAAERFSAAAAGAPEDAVPLFALAQAYIALAQDGRAARTIRKAVRLRPEMLRTKRGIASAFGEPVEFDRVIAALEVRAAAVPSNADSRFVLAVQRYFTGDARCGATFAWLLKAVPADEVAALFVEASVERFRVQQRSMQAGKDPARGARGDPR